MAYIDNETGEVEPPFIKLYLEDLALLNKLARKEHMVLHYLYTKMKYNGTVLIGKKQKDEMCNLFQMSDGSIRNALTSLVKADIMIREANGVYTINPHLAYKGKQGNRMRLVIRYDEISGRSVTLEEDV